MTSSIERAKESHAAAVIASDEGRPARAVRHLRAGLAALNGAEAADDVAEIRGRLLITLAWAESERGRVEIGLRLLDEAETVMGPGQVGVLHGQRALLLKRRGRNEIALQYYDSAVALLRERTHPLELVKTLNNRSLALLEVGRVSMARADLRRSGEIASRHGFAVFVTMSQVNLGCIDVVAGDLPSALERFARSRADYEQIAPGWLAPLAVEHARALVAAGLYGDADRELATAVEVSAAQEQSHTYADALHARAEAALLADRPEAAAAWARQARARFVGRANSRRAALLSLLQLRAEAAAIDPVASGNESGRAGQLAVAARARRLAPRLGALGLPEDERVAGLVAVRALLAAQQPARAGRLLPQYSRPGRADRLDTRLVRRLALAELAVADGRPAESARQLRAGLAAVHRHRAQFGSLDLQTGASVHGRDLARAGLAQALSRGSVPSVYRWSERTRAQALLLPPARPPDDPAIATALEELRQAQYTLRANELAGLAAADLRSRIEALQRKIRERHWASRAPRTEDGPAPASLSQIKTELGDTALISYLRHGPHLHALVLVAGSARLVRLGEYAEAVELVLRLRADLDAQAGRVLPPGMADALAAAIRHDGNRLGAAILDPLLPYLGDRPLVVVPTGALATVAWAAVPAGFGRPITVAPSATTWYAARQRPHHRSGALLVAGPGNKRGADEIHAIATLRPDAAVLTGDTATPAATLRGLGQVALVHLAAHGHHRPENALFSSLDLSGGALFGYDIHGIEPAATVVLSSCDLGLADVRPGDETLGMSTALLVAGSRTVIASVARVADDLAMDVMVRYHRESLAGLPPAAALAAAVPADCPAAFICLGAG